MNFVIKLMSSASDGEKLYAKIGRYLGSPHVRRECGGYPINDGMDYRWMVALEKRGLTPCGFLNFEITQKGAVLHNGYVDAKHRGQGIFREMLRQALATIDHAKASVTTTVLPASAEYLIKHGFSEIGRRGTWIKIERKSR